MCRHAIPAFQLARQALAPGKHGVPIGSVNRPASSGSHNTIGIALQLDGHLAITISTPGEAVQRWMMVGEESPEAG